MDLSRYHRPALQFSGGKDSLACLYLLRPVLDQLTVYWVNTGDACPENEDVVRAVRPMIPNFVEIRSDVKAWRAENGMPSDLIPANGHLYGVVWGLGDTKICGRFECCHHNLILPLHERMMADGVDAVIRGAKRADTGVIPAEGPTPFYDILLPLRDWTHADVFAYLKREGAPVNPIYDYMREKSISAPECFGCTAWWGDGKAAYLKARHPAAYVEHRMKMLRIANVVRSHLDDFESEMRS